MGSASRKPRGPAIPAADIGRIDAVLLSHDQQHGALWISGDTVLYDGVRSVADRVDVGTALPHMGGVRFSVTGPVRYSMTAFGKAPADIREIIHWAPIGDRLVVDV